MKKMMFAVVASFITVAAWAQQAETPDTQVKDIASGKKVAFNQCFEKGKVTVVRFLATWCVPCKKETKNIR